MGLRLLSSDQLVRLSTQRLLAYKVKLMQCTEGPDWDRTSGQVSKSSPEWKSAYEALKSVLAGREHVPKKGG